MSNNAPLMDFDTINALIDSPQWAATQRDYALYLYKLELQREERSQEEIEEAWDDENLRRWEAKREEEG